MEQCVGSQSINRSASPLRRHAWVGNSRQTESRRATRNRAWLAKHHDRNWRQPKYDFRLDIHTWQCPCSFWRHLFMCTVNVVIIGNSGIGKVSLRGQVHTINCLFVRRGSLCKSSLPYPWPWECAPPAQRPHIPYILSTAHAAPRDPTNPGALNESPCFTSPHHPTPYAFPKVFLGKPKVPCGTLHLREGWNGAPWTCRCMFSRSISVHWILLYDVP